MLRADLPPPGRGSGWLSWKACLEALSLGHAGLESVSQADYFRARILELVPVSFSRGSSNPGIEPASPLSPALQARGAQEALPESWQKHAKKISVTNLPETDQPGACAGGTCPRLQPLLPFLLLSGTLKRARNSDRKRRAWQRTTVSLSRLSLQPEACPVEPKEREMVTLKPSLEIWLSSWIGLSWNGWILESPWGVKDHLPL